MDEVVKLGQYRGTNDRTLKRRVNLHLSDVYWYFIRIALHFSILTCAHVWTHVTARVVYASRRSEKDTQSTRVSDREERGVDRWKAGDSRRVAQRERERERGGRAKGGQIRESRKKGRDCNLLNFTVKRDSWVTARLVVLGKKNRWLCYVTPPMKVHSFSFSYLSFLFFSFLFFVLRHAIRFSTLFY